MEWWKSTETDSVLTIIWSIRNCSQTLIELLSSSFLRRKEEYIPEPDHVEEPKERRPAKRLEFISINPHRLVNRIPAPDANNIRGGLTAAQILNFKDFYHQFLKWDISDDESLSAKPFLPIPGSCNRTREWFCFNSRASRYFSYSDYRIW
jgi:hypothetical protein